MAKTEGGPRWGVRSFKTLGLTALWCGTTAVGFEIMGAEERRRGGLTIAVWSLAWGLAFGVGGVTGLSVATVQALIGVVRPTAGRRLAIGSLLVCALVGIAVALTIVFWDRINPRPPMIQQGFHGDML